MSDDDAGLRPPRRKKWIHETYAEEWGSVTVQLSAMALAMAWDSASA